MQVKQYFLVSQHEFHFQIVHHLLLEHVSQTTDYKVRCYSLFLFPCRAACAQSLKLFVYAFQVIVFCTTGMVTSLFYHLLQELKMNVREMHTRKTQHHRARVSEEFREAKRLVLVTSDVSARGMNYPDVTLVIQVCQLKRIFICHLYSDHYRIIQYN